MDTEYISRNHNQAYLRHQNKRAIRKKKKILREVYKVELKDFRSNEENEYIKGALKKGKVHCGCGLCKPGKKLKIDSYKIKEKKRQMDEEIKKYTKKKWDLHI